jgi:hypothetical protein
MEVTSNKRVKVRPVVREREFFKKGHDGEFLFSGCKITIQLPIDPQRGSYVNIFESKEEQVAFEELMGLDKDALSIYRKKDNFWDNFKVSLDKDETVLDLNYPEDVLKLRCLQKHPIVAENMTVADNPQYQYVIVDEAEEKEILDEVADLKLQALDSFNTVKKSKTQMSNILRIMGKNVDTSTMDIKGLQQLLIRIIDTPQSSPGPNIKDFIAVSGDDTIESKVFVLDAIKFGEVTNNYDTYKIKESGIAIGRSLEEASKWFEDPKNQDDKIIISNRVEKSK